MKELFGGTLTWASSSSKPSCSDLGDGDIAAVLAEHQVLAVRRIGDAAIAAARILSERDVVLQNNAGVGVEHLDGLRRAQGEDGGGVTFEIGVQRDGLRADPDAEVDLGAGWGDDLAIADDPRAVRLRAGDVGRIRLGLSSGEPRKAQPRRQQAGERTQTVDPRLISRADFETFFETCTRSPPWIFVHAQPGSAVRASACKYDQRRRIT